MQQSLLKPSVLLANLLLAWGVLFSSDTLAAPFWFVDTVTPYGDQVNFTYQLMVWISIAILVAVEVALVVALIKFRKKPGDRREPETWSHNTRLELIWTIIPVILLVIILVPTMKGVMMLADVPKSPSLTLEVVGRQFFWEYRYPDLNVQFNSSMRMGNQPQEPLHIPVNQTIKVVFTAADVIHSWWVPAFGIQQMTTPGNLAQIPLTVTKVGEYEGACAYLCGAYHGAMNIKVKAVEQAEFDAWIKTKVAGAPLTPINEIGRIGAPHPKLDIQKGGEQSKEKPQGAVDKTIASVPVQSSTASPEVSAKQQTPSIDPVVMAKHGEAIYSARCAACHQTNGAGVPGAIPPLAGAEQVNGDDETFARILLKGLTNEPIKVKGVDYKGLMPAFSDLSDEELASVMTYARASWGNNGKAVSPELVKSLR